MGDADLPSRRTLPFAPFVERACGWGAAEAKVNRADAVVAAAWVRMTCRFGRGGWGSRLFSERCRVLFGEDSGALDRFGSAAAAFRTHRAEILAHGCGEIAPRL